MSIILQRQWIEQSVDDCICPNCHKMFNTTYSRNTHLRQSATCKYWMWYLKTWQIEEPSITTNVEDLSSRPQDFGHAADDFEVENGIFDWIDTAMDLEIGEAGPGPTTVKANQGLKRMLGRLPHSLNVAESQWYSEPHKLGGQVIRMGTTLYERWRTRFARDEEDTLVDNDNKNKLYSPFASRLDWQIAQWAIQETVGQGAFDRLLKIPGVLEHLQLSFKNLQQLNKIVDSIPARGSVWQSKEFRFKDALEDKTFAVRYWDPLKAIKALWGDSSLAEHLVHKPLKVFADAKKLKRSYSEMWTGKWWWAMQSQLKQREATIAPVMLATDKTQLTQFSSSSLVLRWLAEMVLSDKFTRLCLLTWPTIQNKMGVIDFAKIATSSVPRYVKRCMEQGVSGVVDKPFWTDFWGTDIYLTLTPDVLHQLYRGVFKDLVNWCQLILSEDELNSRVRCLPGAMGARQFNKGWSALSQISGSERKHMTKLLLACLVGSAMAGKAIKACHVILDFIYLAQFAFHDEDSLGRM
ncbi:hypothetical protein AAF712_013146 [Marasmius tenuissimus]|uniref:C2H2-type domain-containing protein n=1 Tax=Marasmius tenuissimus TaxID=585030 RepID=A0ABR2ZFF9_9AGAR